MGTPKSKARKRAFRLWRAGHDGLTKLQTIIDRLITEKGEDIELFALGLPDLKLRINKEVRDNAAFELKERREALELSDLEMAHRNGTSLMLQVKAQIEGQLKRLVDLGELVDAVSGGKGSFPQANTEPTDVLLTDGKPLDGLPESAESSEGPPEGSDEDTEGGTDADASEGLPETADPEGTIH